MLDLLALLAAPFLLLFSRLGLQTDFGRDFRWRLQFGGAGAKGTATATAAASLTDSGASWGTTQFVNGVVTAGQVYANIISHTGTVLTIDRWYDAASPGGAAGSTPSATEKYCITPGSNAMQFLALSTDGTAPANGDTTLPSEITTASGGLIAKIATVTHSAGATTGTLSATYTANGSDSLPANVQKVGVGPSLLSGMKRPYQTLITSANMAAVGDQLTPTGTFTL